MSQDLTLRTVSVGGEVAIWDSQQRRFLTGGVTVDSDLVTADVNGKKYVPAGQVIGFNSASDTWGPVADPAVATKETGVVGSNNAIAFSAVKAGAAGNAIKVALVDPSANDSALSISVSGDTVSISLATGSTGAITSTATEVAAAVNADLNAKELISASADVGESTGEGTVAAAEAVALAGGTDAVLEGDVVPSKFALAAENFDVTTADKTGSAVDLARVKAARCPAMSDDVKALVPGITFV